MNELHCHCRHCNQSIPFERSQVGSEIPCPHCQMETLLFIPTAMPAPVIPPHLLPREVAIEESLENVAHTLLTAGIVLAVICAIAGGLFFADLNPVAGFTWFVVGLGAAANGFVANVVFRALAEIIRLLRAINTGRR